MVALLMGAAATAAGAQEPRLGRVSFPTSAGPAAQAEFLRGVLYLHSFEYEQAARAFRAAQQREPRFALAYWGEAMTFTHPVWDQQDADSARAALNRLAPTRQARAALAPTSRERAWLEAVEILYGEGSKARRDTLYARAMERLLEQYPEDAEVRSFTALALLGLNQGVRDVATYMRAAALVEPVFAANPDHPGAAHYLIHAFDDPAHAPLGLGAARAYSRIAPDAAHAQHMTTHIFFALGLWEDGRSQNVIASDLTRWVPGHYTWWLGYALLQQGRYAEALRHLERVRGNMNESSAGQRNHLVFMRGELVINTEAWSSPTLAWPTRPAGAWATGYDAFVRGYAAAKRGDGAEAAWARAAFAAVRDSLRAAGDSLAERALSVMDLELQALAGLAAGDGAGATSLLGRAAAIEEALPVDFGPPGIVKPSFELLGEVLLGLGRPAEAQRAFMRALQLAPGRARALIGLVRAASAAGDAPVAANAYRQLAANWQSADGDLPILRQLQGLVAVR